MSGLAVVKISREASVRSGGQRNRNRPVHKLPDQDQDTGQVIEKTGPEYAFDLAQHLLDADFRRPHEFRVDPVQRMSHLRFMHSPCGVPQVIPGPAVRTRIVVAGFRSPADCRIFTGNPGTAEPSRGVGLDLVAASAMPSRMTGQCSAKQIPGQRCPLPIARYRSFVSLRVGWWIQ